MRPYLQHSTIFPLLKNEQPWVNITIDSWDSIQWKWTTLKKQMWEISFAAIQLKERRLSFWDINILAVAAFYSDLSNIYDTPVRF